MKKIWIVGILSSLLALTAAKAQHINAGAFDSDSNGSLDKLYFANGASFASGSGYIFNATYRTTGVYAGYYDLAPSFTALAAFAHSGQPGQDDTTASPLAVEGSLLKLQLVSVTGPTTGTLSYWAIGATTPTFSLDAGQAAAGNEIWNVSNPDIAWLDGTPSAGQPGGEPYGHIHGQRFTVDLPGTYTVGFQLIDTVPNPLASSDIFYITVAAVPEPSTWALLTLGALVIVFAARRGFLCKRSTVMKSAVIVLSLGACSSALAHVHISAGVQDSNNNGVADQGDKLYFTNGSFYQSGNYTWNLAFQSPGQDYAGFYVTDVPPPVDSGFTFAVQPATLMNGGPAFSHPALGSFIELRIVSVTGPAGGHLAWWDEDDQEGPTVSFDTGLTGGTYQFNLSEGSNAVDSDPYGHVHGRTFGVDLPGSYLVGFQLVDISTFGIGGGPIAASSEIYYMNFNAIPEPQTWILLIAGFLGVAAILKRSQMHSKIRHGVILLVTANLFNFQGQVFAEPSSKASAPWALLNRQSEDLLQALKKQTRIRSTNSRKRSERKSKKSRIRERAQVPNCRPY